MSDEVLIEVVERRSLLRVCQVQGAVGNILLQFIRRMEYLTEQLIAGSDNVLHAKFQNLWVERLCNVSLGTDLKTLPHGFLIVLRSEKYHRNMGCENVVLQMFTQLNTIHLGHHYIRDYHINRIFLCDFESLHTIDGSINIVSFLKCIGKELQKILIVLNNKDGSTVVGISFTIEYGIG